MVVTFVGTQLHGRACGVYCDVTAADNCNTLAGEVRPFVASDVTQHLDCRKDAVSVLAFELQSVVALGADCNVDHVVLPAQLIEISHRGIAVDFDAAVQDPLDLFLKQIVRQPIVGDAIPEHAA